MRQLRRSCAMLIAVVLILLGCALLPQGRTVGRCPDLTTPVFADQDPSSGATGFALIGQADADFSANSVQLGARFTAAPEPAPGLVGVHLLIRGADRIYAADRDRITAAIGAGYLDHGAQFWAPGSSDCGVAVRRFTKNGISSYALTSGDRQRLAAAGWTDAGIAFRADPLSGFQWPEVSGKGPLDLRPYNDPDSLAWQAYRQATGPDRQALYQLAATPAGIWLGPSDTIGRYVDRISTAAAELDQAPQFVLYAIPHRDCGGYASGGVADLAAYRQWIDAIRTGLAGRPAVVIVEPDAIGMSCLNAAQAGERIAMLRYALRTLSTQPDVWVYLHAGSAGLDPTTMATDLINAGIGYARGFAVNVSGFDTTANEIAYGKQIVAALDADQTTGKHFVVDTSRNGAGRPPAGSTGTVPQWCNPPGRALGVRPTPRTSDPDVDALLWVKPPGETDGPCYPGDPAHGWFNSYALGLVTAGLERRTIADLPHP